jgi:hypothetical protein
MKIENLRYLPQLVSAMEENLYININDFIDNPTLRDLKLNKTKLIEIIKSSKKFNYDTKSSTIKIKEKADRNLLIVKSLISIDSTNEEVQEKEDYLRKVIKSFKDNIKIKKIERVEAAFFVIFEHEDISMQVEKFILAGSEYNFEVCLAAESFKRRIMSNINPKYTSVWAQIQFVNSLVNNQSVIPPRRNTQANFNSRITLGRGSQSIIKSESNSRSNSKSPSPDNNMQGYESSYLSFANNDIFSRQLSMKNKIVHAHSLENKFNSKYNINNFQPKKSFNKFDFPNQKLKVRKILSYGQKPHEWLKIDKKRVSNFSDFCFDNKRDSLMSIGTIMELPYYREQSKAIQFNETEKILFENNSDNHEEKKKPKISYLNKEIFSVFYHLQFLKTFEKIPDDIENNFIEEVMNHEIKSELECLKMKNHLAKKVKRAGTFNETHKYRNRSNTIIELEKNIHSSRRSK